MLTVQEITNKLTPVFEANDVRIAILFGSYAKGTPTESSDIDLVVETANRLEGWDALGVKVDIEDALPIPADVFHQFELVPNGPLDKEVKETGRVIYARE